MIKKKKNKIITAWSHFVTESDLNFMFATALDKIAFLPFAYIMDRYRYDVFSGKISTEELNQGWWDYA